MKKNYSFELSLFLIIAFSSFAIAQTSLGSSKTFMNNLKNGLASSTLKSTAEKTVLLQAGNKDFNGKINYKESNTSSEFLIGEIKNVPESSFYIKVMDNSLEGHIILKKTKEAYKYYSDTQGNAFVSKVDINTLICVDYKNASEKVSESVTKTTNKSATAKISPELLNLQSLPGAKGCVLLDFDGYYMPAGTVWNNGNSIDAAPSTMSEAEIQINWEVVAEDFRPFNLNITTNESVYNSYPKNRRMRVVITPTNIVAPGTGGVAYVGSFNWDNDVPCWVFLSSGRSAGKTCSHEIGHTFDLSHDGLNSGEEYYSGISNTAWAPIMGFGSYRPVVQWSKGEYNNANNKQDDVAIIAGTKFGIGYNADDYGNTIASAANLDYNANGVINQKNGVISNEADYDFFTFTTGGGNVSINANTVARNGNIHLLMKLYNAAGVEMGRYTNPDPFALNASMNINLPAGKYFISVSGTGAGNVGSGGYSAYGSIGSYSISGTILPSVKVNPSTDVVTVYKDFNYSGFSGGLTIGDYNLERLNSLGVLNDDISSLKIAQGFQAILYQDDNFTGASIVVNSDTESLNSSWNDKVSSVRIRANGVTTLDAQTFFLQNRNSGLNMELQNVKNEDPANIIQANTNKNYQQYKFAHLGDGLYIINSGFTNRALTVNNANKANGVTIEENLYAGNANQQFVVVATGDGFYKLIARHSGKLVEVAGGSKENGAIVQQWENTNQTCGQWKLISAIEPDNATLIQAEDYSAMIGITTEVTTDVGGGLNVTNAEMGDSLTYNNINFPGTGSYLIEYRVASAVNGAQIFTYLNGQALFLGNVNIPNTGGWQNWQTVTQTVNVNDGNYNFDIYIQNKSLNINWIRISKIETQTSTLIQAENYSAMDGIKTQATKDLGGGLNVTTEKNVSWLGFDKINFPTSGSYLIEYRVASAVNDAQIYLDFNQQVNNFGKVDIPYTGGLQQWQTVKQNINVNAGTYNVALYIVKNANVNWIRITKLTSQESTLIQAEDYAAMDGIKTQVTTDVGGGLNVTNEKNVSWLGFNKINFPTSGSYLVEYRVASAVDGSQIYLDLSQQVNNFGKVEIPNTGGWQNWKTVKQTINVNVNAGTYNATLYIVKNVNINWIRISKIEPETTALIQAEDYSAMKGITTEVTTDVGGGLNITDAEMADSLLFENVNFPVSGTYTIEYRVATNGTAKIFPYLNNESIFLGNVDILNTRGMQNWQTVTQTVNVNEGTTNLYLHIQKGPVNINWIRITRVGKAGVAAATANAPGTSSIISEQEITDVELMIYPNPVSDILFFSTDVTGGNVSVIDSQTGSLIISHKINDNNLNVSGLRTGVYLIVLEKDGTKTIKRFIKK